jgi:hypothetical protein
MTVLGQAEKNSLRAFRFALELGHCSMQSACLKCADTVAKLPKSRATNFPQIDQTSRNLGSMSHPRRYRSRLRVHRRIT